MDFIVAKFNYWLYVIIMMIGLYAMIAKRNYIKKLLGMSIFQTSIILFYVSLGTKNGATIPILGHETTAHGHVVDPDKFANPLPHVLMLTAIVVGVATLGLGLAVVQKVYKEYGTIEEHELLDQLKRAGHE